jgi:hypothetical protein
MRYTENMKMRFDPERGDDEDEFQRTKAALVDQLEQWCKYERLDPDVADGLRTYLRFLDSTDRWKGATPAAELIAAVDELTPAYRAAHGHAEELLDNIWRSNPN